jgi:hypothetical protein
MLYRRKLYTQFGAERGHEVSPILITTATIIYFGCDSADHG